jgi:hypothetical protein
MPAISAAARTMTKKSNPLLKGSPATFTKNNSNQPAALGTPGISTKTINQRISTKEV